MPAVYDDRVLSLLLTTGTALQSPCNQLIGSCLSNQLYDLYTADVARVAGGTTPVYMVARWGGGNPNARQVMKASSTIHLLPSSLLCVTPQRQAAIDSEKGCILVHAPCPKNPQESNLGLASRVMRPDG